MEDNKIDNTSEYKDRDDYSDNGYEKDLSEFENMVKEMKWTKGIEDVSSSQELQYVCDIMYGYPFYTDFEDYEGDDYDEYDETDHARARQYWYSDVATPEDIKKHILEDMANISIFKGKLTPEAFDSEVKAQLEELDEEFSACDIISEEDVPRMERSELESIKEVVHAIFDENLLSQDIIPCGGIITGKNRYIYCFYDAYDGFFFGKEFVVDEKGKINEGTNAWMVIGRFKGWGKSDFWDISFEWDKHGESDVNFSYVPGLIALYSMAKYVTDKRNQNTIDKVA